MAVATHLADKSALARLDQEAVARRLGPMIEAGLVGTCVIHYDRDYDLIAEVTNQATEWVVPQGSVR